MIKTLMTIAAATGLTGCGTLPTSVTNPGGATPLRLSAENCTVIGTMPGIEAMSLGCSASTSSAASSDTSITPMAVTEEKRFAAALLYSLIAQSDQKCDEHMTHVASTWNGTSSALGVLSALSSAAGAVTVDGTTQVLSAVSTGARNSRTVLSKSIFGDQAYPIIRRAISKRREELRGGLVEYGKVPDVNTVGEALSEATRYHSACGTSFGISVIEKAVADATNGEEPTPPVDPDTPPGGVATPDTR